MKYLESCKLVNGGKGCKLESGSLECFQCCIAGINRHLSEISRLKWMGNKSELTRQAKHIMTICEAIIKLHGIDDTTA